MPRWLKIGLGVLAAAVLLVFGRSFGGAIARFAEWLRGLGPEAPLLYVLGYGAATVVLAPASLLTLAAGALFGLGRGLLYAFSGALLGSNAAFLVSRHLARPLVERRLGRHERLRRIDAAIGRRGARIVLLLRLSPVLPFNLLNYALGLTRVGFRAQLLGSVGMLPGTLLYVYYGKVAGDVAALAAGAGVRHDRGYYAVLGLGLAATLAATLMVTRIARRELGRETGVDDG